MGVQDFIAEYQAGAASRESQPAWLQTRRQDAIDSFAQLGMPTSRQEEWRFTDVTPINELSIEQKEHTVPPPSVVLKQAIDDSFDLVVFVDGRIVTKMSLVGELPPGARLVSFDEALASTPQLLERDLGSIVHVEDAFAALNTALYSDGLLLSVPDGAVLSRPVQVIFITTSGSSVSYPRVLLQAGRDSSATLVETHIGFGTEPYLSNAVTELIVGQGARVEHHKLQLETAQGMHVATIQARQQRDSRFLSTSMSLGGALVRNNISARVASGSHCELLGLYLASGKQHVDHHTVIDHAEPNATSNQLYHGVVGDEASAVFNGKIFVREGSQQTNARQSNRNLLLSDGATINAKPQLEIWADDVRCTHGATVGQLDAEALFYLRSRGLDERQAREVLLHAFARSVLDELRNDRLRGHVEQLVRDHLGRAAQGDLRSDRGQA